MGIKEKKLFNREVEKKEAANEAAKEYSQREDNRIKYDKYHPLYVDCKTQILELSILEDEYETEQDRLVKSISALFSKEEKDLRKVETKTVRVRFKDTEREYEKEEDESNPFFIDIRTNLSLENLEQEIMKCIDEENLYELENKLIESYEQISQIV